MTKFVEYGIDDDGDVVGRTRDNLTNADKIAIVKHILNHLDFKEVR